MLVTLDSACFLPSPPTHTHTQWSEAPGLQLVGEEQRAVMAGAAAESKHGRDAVRHAPGAEGATVTGNAQLLRGSIFLIPSGAEDVVPLVEAGTHEAVGLIPSTT